jgi:hypothetical protein
MPDGLLLAAFALTLVVNAVLIVVAIRAMQPGGALSDQPRRRRDESAAGAADPQAPLHGSSAGRAAEVLADEARNESVAAPVALPPEPPRRGGRRPRKPPEGVDPPTSPAPKRARRESRAASSADAAPARGDGRTASARARKTATPGGNGRRRRFSLPPLDEDGEKVSRSIETFLSGGEASPDPDGNDADDDADVPPTTVALLAVTDAGTASPGTASPSRNGHEPSRAEDAPLVPGESAPPATDDALAAVERSLRSAARGTDRVDAQQTGRFRVVLAPAGELAARAYLRRVRATVEPLLDELDPPRRLAVATATVLDDPLERADELAERRLATAIEANDRDHRAGDGERLEKPRASGD